MDHSGIALTKAQGKNNFLFPYILFEPYFLFKNDIIESYSKKKNNPYICITFFFDAAIIDI